MGNNTPNQPNQNKPADQSKNPKPADTKPQGQDKGRTEDPKHQVGGTQRDGGESQRSDRASGDKNQAGKGETNQKTRDDSRQPGAALPNPKMPHYGDKEPGDPRKTDIEAGRKGAVQNPADAGE
ncbi:MAG: hypothetical protein SGI72_01160 [Planctomycetota bacterium]|nr:hypothetical protein [Planctomycetota bacterium]